MESGGEKSEKTYYGVLGLDDSASSGAIRAAYKKLAMKWHPDKCNDPDGVKAKLKFQELQEAYAVLSDEKKKMLYDNGLYSLDDDDDDIESLSSFVNEISSRMVADIKASKEVGQSSSFEDLQQLFVSMFGADLGMFNNPSPSSNCNKKRGWGARSNCGSSSPQTNMFFNDDSFNNVDSKTTKRSKNTNSSSSGTVLKQCDHSFNS